MKIKFLSFVAVACMFSSCLPEDLYKNEDNTEKKDVSAFSNFSSVKVNFQSEGEFVSIFFNNSHADDGAIADPYLSGRTPIQTELSVPNHVDSLVVIVGGKLRTYAADEAIRLGIHDFTETKSSIKTNTGLNYKKIVDLVNNTYFPEMKYNLKREELYKCTDLSIDENLSGKEFEVAEVFVTYLSDGFFSRSGQYGKLWAYTYDKNKRDRLTLSDCTFYGFDANGDGNADEVAYADISQIKDGLTAEAEGAKPIFWSKEEQPKSDRGDYSTLKIGKFKKGMAIGFVFKGHNEKCQFSTPELNTSDYLNYTLAYKDGGADFQIKKRAANGFVYNLELEDKVFVNILGMENRTPNFRGYDGDYNDMLCYVHSNPLEALKPDENLKDPEEGAGDYTREKGLYLFEDNYPKEGDYDFNDVVISYEIRDYFKKNEKKVAVQVLARGGNKPNQFGFKVRGKSEVLIDDITGYVNVGTDEFSPANYSEVYRATFRGDIKPFLYNGVNYIYDDSYFNEGDYPYVLIIPSFGKADDYFNWCINSKRIDEVYNFKAPRAADWYLEPVNKEAVVKRAVAGDK